jgi:hypothetical protein
MQDAFGVARRRTFMGSFRLRLGRFAHTTILTQGGKVKNPTRRYGVWGTRHPRHPQPHGWHLHCEALRHAGEAERTKLRGRQVKGGHYLSGLQVQPAPGANAWQKILAAGLGGKLARMRQLAGGTDTLRQSWL